MRHVNKKKLLAALASTACAVITLTVITPNLASAQSGDSDAGTDQTNSRLCGQYTKSSKSGEVVTLMYEAAKGAICNPPNISVGASPFSDRLKDKENNYQNWSSAQFTGEVCEGWKTRSATLGGLDGRDLNFIGDPSTWPSPHDQKDICENMKRTSVDGLHLYWLYDDNDPKTAAVDFQRG
jgi:hypothetical protein